ncbi:MAG: CHASE domain-containing protein, partial [Caldimonas sp.]
MPLPPARSTLAPTIDGWTGRLLLLPFGLTTLAYVAAGLASQLLAIPPGYASPLYPAAGIALASVLVYGWRLLGAVAIGAVGANAVLIAARGSAAADAILVVSLAMGFGAVLQAAVGAGLVRRYVRQPLALTLPGDVARFMAACLASSVVAASVTTLALRATGAAPNGSGAFTWLTFWVGNLAGLLIATPIALTLIGRPTSEWTPRRLPVGVTLALVTTFLALGIVQLGRWNSERVRDTFDNDASSASLILATQLQEPLRALEALHGIFSVSHQLTRNEVRQATASWLESGNIRSMGWSERVHHDDIATFEARARAEGALGYRIYDRPRVAAAASASASASASAAFGLGLRSDNGDVVAIRHIEPFESNAAALGLNAVSIPAGRDAIMGAVDSGRPAVTTGFKLTARGEGDQRTGVILYQAIYDGEATSPEQRRSAFRGLVFVALTMDRQLENIAGKIPKYLDLCIVDAR